MSPEPFGTWLLRQKSRSDWIGELAKSASNDPGFPKTGQPRDVYVRLNKQQVDGDVFAALDAAIEKYREAFDLRPGFHLDDE